MVLTIRIYMNRRMNLIDALGESYIHIQQGLFQGVIYFILYI